ncbi:MAG: GGDEF domain-containing protein [Lachnospiraceae bacterium]|nr:GGDEF domain-containing protein [Lachnospiraceae bacterium]
MHFLFIGINSLIVFVLLDSIIYLLGYRNLSGYATFSRIGSFIFFVSMGMEVIQIITREYNSLRKYGYVDELTGLGNRRAYMKFQEENKNIYPYGYVMCDVNSLKLTNDKFGHKRGDELIKAVAQKMAEIYGENNVFRVGGDEFVAFSFEPTLRGFNAQTRKATELLSGEASASIGGAYAADASCDLQDIKKDAEDLMYDAKDKYYINSKDRRR